jgi:hypothetical protein
MDLVVLVDAPDLSDLRDLLDPAVILVPKVPLAIVERKAIKVMTATKEIPVLQVQKAIVET